MAVKGKRKAGKRGNNFAGRKRTEYCRNMSQKSTSTVMINIRLIIEHKNSMAVMKFKSG